MMTSMMQEVMSRGTAASARSLGRSDIAGKTGTTNDHRDAWFAGYNADVTVSCWVGFDDLSPLGDQETGGHAALPMWMAYVGPVLKDAPESTVPRPDGLETVRINPATGALASSTSPDAIFETFPSDRVPGAGAGDGYYGSSGGGRVIEELF
jgi:penicillin-binding protein 1A